MKKTRFLALTLAVVLVLMGADMLIGQRRFKSRVLLQPENLICISKQRLSHHRNM